MNWLSVKLSLKHWCGLSEDLVKRTLPFCIIYDHSTDIVNRVPVHVLRGPGATGPPRTPVLPTLYFQPLGPPPPQHQQPQPGGGGEGGGRRRRREEEEVGEGKRGKWVGERREGRGGEGSGGGGSGEEGKKEWGRHSSPTPASLQLQPVGKLLLRELKEDSVSTGDDYSRLSNDQQPDYTLSLEDCSFAEPGRGSLKLTSGPRKSVPTRKTENKT